MTSRTFPLLLALAAPVFAQAPDLRDRDLGKSRALQSAVRQATIAASPWTVRVEALGGSRAGSGPLFDEKGNPSGFNAAMDAASTGVILTADGLVATSTFNLQTNPRILTVILADGREFTAKVAGRDDARMIALLEIEAEGLPTPEVVPVADIEPGIWALALGRTFSGPREPPTVNLGIISAKGRHDGKALQTDASVNPSNYGGPLVDVRGRGLGIIVPYSEGDQEAGVGFYDSGIGFAIPLEDVLAIAPRIAGGKSAAPGFLGVQSDQAFAGPGVRISQVLPDTAAARAGLAAGDVVLSVDGVAVPDLASLQKTLKQKFQGDKIRLTVHRGDEDLEIEVELGARP